MGSCFSAESRNPLPASPTSTLGIGKKRNFKKRPPRLRSFDHQREEQLRKIAGRMFLNGSSEVASLFTQQGKKGTNQDAMIVWENFGSRTDTVFCGVFDGHGPFGHMVAKRVRDSLPLKLSAHWEVNLKNTDDVLREIVGRLNEGTSNDASMDFEGTDKNPEIFQTLKESFLKAFKVMDRELSMYASVDCFCSGTTAVTLVKQGHHLIIGNIGDSRAVLCTKDEDNSLVPVQLTVDLKPNLPGLSFRTSEESLRNAFQPFGQLIEVNLVMDKIANRPRGFAFLRYATKEESEKAIEGMHGKFLDGRVIFVEYAKPRSQLNQGVKQDSKPYR